MTSSSPKQVDGCAYNILPEGIHELVLLASTEKALDECFVYLDDIFSQAPVDQPLLLMSDIRQSGIPPAAHLWRNAREFLRKFPRRPHIYDAILHAEDRTPKVLLVTVGQLAGLYGATVRFFNSHQRDEAIAWLCDQLGPASHPKPPDR
jgi:hypothetical protein